MHSGRLRNRTRWIAFLDADEFLLPHLTNDVKQFLQGYERASAVGVNWQMFGDNGHEKRPSGLITNNYVLRGPEEYVDNAFVKSIVNPKDALGPANPHCFYLRNGRSMINANGSAMKFYDIYHQCYQTPPCVNEVQINHYYTRSAEDFAIKINRGGGAGLVRGEAELDKIRSQCNKVEDKRICRFAQQIEAMMGSPGLCGRVFF